MDYIVFYCVVCLWLHLPNTKLTERSSCEHHRVGWLESSPGLTEQSMAECNWYRRVNQALIIRQMMNEFSVSPEPASPLAKQLPEINTRQPQSSWESDN